tara:strand:- start:163 stop:807 length:645 start_codon:yes stop_codon:yes gene_type:complete
MANTLYSAYMAAGSSAGKYKASLYETSDWADKFDFIGKQTAWEEEKTSRRVSAIGDTLELASTVYGGYQDKEKTLSRAESLEGKYGALQEDKRGLKDKGMDWLMGKEQTYTFGEGESATTLSKTAVGAQGAIAMGESMLGEYQDKFYGEGIKKEIKNERPTLSLERQGFLFGGSLAKGLSNILSDDNTVEGSGSDESFWFSDKESADPSSWENK